VSSAAELVPLTLTIANAPTPCGVDNAQMMSSLSMAQRYIDKY